MSQTKFLLVSLLAIFVFLLPYNNILLAQEESGEVLPLALDMFKFDQYLPALDMLEANVEANKENFNYWLYIGLARQRTKQLNKALEAYETALKLNPDANNLKIRINNLKKSISNIDAAQIKDFKTNEEKSKWLLDEADSLRREKKEEKAFRTFIQAVEYDVKLLGNDKNFVRRGVVYYKLKVEDKAEYSKLFYAIFKYFEGEITEAYNIIKEFKNDGSKKSLAIQYLEKNYYKKLAEANNQQKDYEMAEREERRQKQLEAEKAKLAKAELKDKKDKTSTDRKNQKEDIRDLEKEISQGTFTYEDDHRFEVKYFTELNKFKIEEYFNVTDPRRKRQIIWELGQTGSQDEEIMNVIIDGLKQETIDYMFVSTDALVKIGMPSAEKAYPVLYNVLDSERYDFKQIAMDALGRLRVHPDQVVPKFISLYSEETSESFRKNYSRAAERFGKVALDIAYKILEEKSRVDRKPVAEFIHDITGEKVDDLVNR